MINIIFTTFLARNTEKQVVQNRDYTDIESENFCKYLDFQENFLVQHCCLPRQHEYKAKKMRSNLIILSDKIYLINDVVKWLLNVQSEHDPKQSQKSALNSLLIEKKKLDTFYFKTKNVKNILPHFCKFYQACSKF